MEVIEVNEAFTSKTSPFADIFEVRKIGKEYFTVKEKQKPYSKLFKGIEKLTKAVREKRGLLKDKVLNKAFNADLVGAIY